MLLYNNNPRATRLSTKDLSQVNYTRAIEILKERYANAADFTFVILAMLIQTALNHC